MSSDAIRHHFPPVLTSACFRGVFLVHKFVKLRAPRDTGVGGSNPSSDSMSQAHYLKDGDYLGEGFPQ
jgi:hypothetical protein